MALDSSLLLKVKDHVTTKLKSIGAFIDEELPDYIMVMVANKKNEASMTNDLQLFLGDHAAEFTKWLHKTLNNLQNTSLAPSKDKESTSVLNKSKSSGRRKASKIRSPEKCRIQKTETDSRARSPLQSRRTEKGELCSREPHAAPELLNIHLEENEFTNEDISSTANIQEERKVVSTSNLTSPTDGSRETTGLRSVIQVKKAEKRSRPDCLEETEQAGGRLLKLAFEGVRSTTVEQRKPVEVDKHRSDSRRRRAIDRKVACSPDVSSSSNSNVTSTAVGCEPETRFYVTLSGSTDVDPSHGIDSDEENAPKRSVPNTFDTSLKARLGKRCILPNLSDQQQLTRVSMPVNSMRRPSLRDRLGPLIRSRSGQKFISHYAEDEVELSEDLEGVDFVEITEEPSEDYSCVEPTFATGATSITSSKLQPNDRLNQRQLMVHLHDVTKTGVVGTGEDSVAATHRPVPLCAAGDTNNTNSTAMENGRVLPNTLKRCKFWPQCRNSEKCAFIHPSQYCTAFPRCGLASTCTFVHPPCRYGALCRRKDCAYDHSIPSSVSSTAATLSKPSSTPSTMVDKVPCRYGRGCTRPQCQYYHQPKVAPKSTNNASVTLTTSPVPCRYGPACTSRPKCPFLHLDLPRPDQLKWRATGIGQSQESKETIGSAGATTVANVSTSGKPLQLTS